MQTHFRHLSFKSFPMIEGTFKSNEFKPLKSLFEDLGIHQNSNSQSGSSVGSVEVHSFTLFYTFESMRCNSRASLLAYTFASPCLCHEPKARVGTIMLKKVQLVWTTINLHPFVLYTLLNGPLCQITI